MAKVFPKPPSSLLVSVVLRLPWFPVVFPELLCLDLFACSVLNQLIFEGLARVMASIGNTMRSRNQLSTRYLEFLMETFGSLPDPMTIFWRCPLIIGIELQPVVCPLAGPATSIGDFTCWLFAWSYNLNWETLEAGWSFHGSRFNGSMIGYGVEILAQKRGAFMKSLGFGVLQESRVGYKDELLVLLLAGVV